MVFSVVQHVDSVHVAFLDRRKDLEFVAIRLSWEPYVPVLMEYNWLQGQRPPTLSAAPEVYTVDQTAASARVVIRVNGWLRDQQ